MSDVPEPEFDEAAPVEAIAEGSGPHDAAELAEAVQVLGAVGGESHDATERAEGSITTLAESVEDADGEAGDGDEAVAAALPTSAAAMDDAELVRLLEALVFASDKPLTLARLRQLTRIADTARLEAALARLGAELAERGVMLAQVSGGYQLRTASRFASWVQQLIAGRPVRLSRAQLETLAIVAYRQPITRPEIDDIRGVDSSNTLRVLAERQLVRVLGKREEVGRPLLYGTTKEFLDFFSLGDLRELPTLRECSELTAESREVVDGYSAPPPGGAARSGEAGPIEALLATAQDDGAGGGE